MLNQRIQFFSNILKKCILNIDASILIVATEQHNLQLYETMGFNAVTLSTIVNPTNNTLKFQSFIDSASEIKILDLAENSFDYVVIQNGLHFSRMPHKALVEMYRVARIGVMLFDGRDSATIKIMQFLGITESYEVKKTYFSRIEKGNMNDDLIPNHVYRWSEREIIKTINSFAPHALHDFKFYYGHAIPSTLLFPNSFARKIIFQGLYKVYCIVISAFNKQQNLFASYIGKNIAVHPWIISKEDRYIFNRDWARANFYKGR